MNSKIFTPRFIFISSAVLLAALSRVLPHFDNFTPIAAMALFGGVYFSDKRLAFIIPLIAMLISDVLIELITGWGFHNTIPYVYAAFIITSAIGLYVRKNTNIQTVIGASLLSSVLFFILTNFGYWAANGGIGGAGGLGIAYVTGIPFFANTLIGDLFYNGILFGAFYFAQRRIPALVK